MSISVDHSAVNVAPPTIYSPRRNMKPTASSQVVSAFAGTACKKSWQEVLSSSVAGSHRSSFGQSCSTENLKLNVHTPPPASVQAVASSRQGLVRTHSLPPKANAGVCLHRRERSSGHLVANGGSFSTVLCTSDGSPLRSLQRRKDTDSSGDSSCKESRPMSPKNYPNLMQEVDSNLRHIVEEIVNEKALPIFRSFEEIALQCQAVSRAVPEQLDEDLLKVRAHLEEKLARVHLCNDSISKLQQDHVTMRNEFCSLVENFAELETHCNVVTSKLDDQFSLIRECSDSTEKLQVENVQLREDVEQLKKLLCNTEGKSDLGVQASMDELKRHQQKWDEELDIVKNCLHSLVDGHFAQQGDTGSVYGGRDDSSTSSGQAEDARAVLRALSNMRDEITRLGSKLEQGSREKSVTRDEVACMLKDFRQEIHASARQRLNAAMATA